MKIILHRCHLRTATWLCLLGSLVLLVGCVPTKSSPVTLVPFDSVAHRAIKVEPCEDRTGLAGPRNLKEESTKIFTEKLKSMNLFEISPAAPLVLTCDLESFVEGSALKRWVTPSWGTTEATVAVVVRDVPNDKMLAILRSQASVDRGGLYTIGADQYILDAAFDDIMKQLKAWTKNSR